LPIGFPRFRSKIAHGEPNTIAQEYNGSEGAIAKLKIQKSKKCETITSKANPHEMVKKLAIWEQ